MDEHKRAYKVDEAARLLSLGRTTTWSLVTSGELRTIRVGRAVLIPDEAIDDFLRRRTGTSPAR